MNPIAAPLRRLTCRMRCERYTGYGELGCQVFEWFTKLGIFLAVRPLSVDDKWGQASSIPLQMRAQLVTPPQPEEWELLIGTPDNFPTPRKKTAFFTMYESTEMPPQYVANLNRSELVIVPCSWNARHFKENGVKPPIVVVPLGFRPDVYQHTKLDDRKPTVFGVAGRTQHCAARKNVQAAIDLFLKTFPTQDDVRLHVKIQPDDKINDVKDYRVKVSREHLEPYEIANWLRSLTVYVTLSRGEGFGLWALQSLAAGRPVLGCKYSGHEDFLTEANSFIVPHREVDAVSDDKFTFPGQWADPNLKVAARLMQAIHAKPDIAFEKSLIAASSVGYLTWEKSAEKLFDALAQVGAV